MNTGYRVSYTDDALNDLSEIVSYIACELCSPRAARDVVARIRSDPATRHAYHGVRRRWVGSDSAGIWVR